MIEHLPNILLAYSAFLVGMMSPGPNIMAVIGTSMGIGRDAGRALAFGIATGSFLWGCLTLAGLTVLIATYASVLSIIKIIGAFYLFWLALKAFRSVLSPNDLKNDAIRNAKGFTGYFRRGLLIQMTNPKAALTWVAIISIAMHGDAPFATGSAVVAGATVLSALGHLGYALLFSTDPIVAAYRRAHRWIEAALGGFFCFASYKILTTEK